MDSKIVEATDKPHAVCIPCPVQSHIKAMLKFAKLLHCKGFHITFVNTEFNHQRFLKSGGPKSLDGLPDFQFKTIPDGLPPSDSNATQDIDALSESIMENLLAPFSDILVKLNTATSNNLPVTCIIADGFLAFTHIAARELGIPIVMLFTVSACSLMGFMQFPRLRDKGLTPLKDESYLTNGYLDTVLDWIPGMRDIRLRDLPSYVRTTDPNDPVFKATIEAVERAPAAAGIVVHSFDALEQEVLNALSSMLPRVYAIGPQQLLLNHAPNDPLKSTGYSLWKEETDCLNWLNSKAPNSVIYVNFGSITVMTPQQLVEFGWGLAKSKFMFLWIIRPDLVAGDSSILPPELLEETKGRGLIASWCPQEEVLNHSSIGGFLTHCGWNSTMESLCAGVPMLCCPFFADQQTNCKYACNEWGIGMEIDNGAKRGEVEKIVRELMEGNRGKKMKKKVMEWKKLAEEATGPHGSSSINLDKLVNEVLLSKG
ncbi:7-deoxyloganetin glucosyltransferase-like isoform X1 [Alnus glutinosa]|uniref:7-deoxyloganetin glucosyltransferase-like isoform X1 n=2 Tax=Alnus glutinosa TaxID=3517 RepID=UPI002D77900C|nr:7-deoxyloganetin glucosyltransferase-like isoform X1 [Alnus glutinosa]